MVRLRMANSGSAGWGVAGGDVIGDPPPSAPEGDIGSGYKAFYHFKNYLFIRRQIYL